MIFPNFLRRHPVFYSTRFWLILKKPKKVDFIEEHCNKHVSNGMIPAEFKHEISLIGIGSDDDSLTGAKKIIQYMNDHYGTGKGLGQSTVEVLTALKTKTGGVCSDYSSVFTALCLAKGIKVREWGLVANLQYKLRGRNHGHSFNEVFCDILQKWILLDPYFGIYFQNRNTRNPMSATELIDLHIFNRDKITQVHFIKNKRLEPEEQAKINNCYFRQNVFFLLKDYNIFSQDKILRLHKRFPLPVLHFLLILLNRYYSYIIYINEHNRSFMRNQLRKVLKFNYK